MTTATWGVTNSPEAVAAVSIMLCCSSPCLLSAAETDAATLAVCLKFFGYLDCTEAAVTLNSWQKPLAELHKQVFKNHHVIIHQETQASGVVMPRLVLDFGQDG